jgi:MHS family proline/betaine transporter-like MFS transporter
MNKKISQGVLTSCFLAGLLEIYDFTIFGFLTPILYKNYLSFMKEEDALIITYALFAVGFLFRPVGAILFGYIGDKYGRKIALVLSVSLMGLASFVMFALPPYSYIGILACYIIALVRIIQGISVGGEYSGAIIYAIEHFDKKRIGFVGAIVVSGCLFGVMLGRFIGNILQSPSLPEYSWRFAFLLGFILSIVGYFIRNKLTESPEFKTLALNKINNKTIPLLEGIKQFPMEMIAAISLIGVNGVNFYFIVVFFPDYIKKTNGVDITHISLISTIIPAFFAPIMGWVSDRSNRGVMLLMGIGLIGLYSVFALPLMLKSTDTSVVTLLIFIYAVLFSIQSGTINTYTIEIFPVKCRFSCGALCYALGMGVIGGTSPMIAAFLTKVGTINSVVSYVLIITAIGFIFCYFMVIKRNKKKIHNILIKIIEKSSYAKIKNKELRIKG